MSLYNLKSEDGQWRITKFDNDLNVESSYIVDIHANECGCPAGVAPTCRHRKMLPKMLAVGAEDSAMFYDFDHDQFLEPLGDSEDTQPAIVSPIEDESGLETEFESELSPSSPSQPKPASAASGSYSNDLHDSDCATHNEPAYPNGPCDCSLSKPHSTTVSASDFESVDVGSNPTEAAKAMHPAISGPLKRRI